MVKEIGVENDDGVRVEGTRKRVMLRDWFGEGEGKAISKRRTEEVRGFLRELKPFGSGRRGDGNDNGTGK